MTLKYILNYICTYSNRYLFIYRLITLAGLFKMFLSGEKMQWGNPHCFVQLKPFWYLFYFKKFSVGGTWGREARVF